MPLDPEIAQANRAATERLRALAASATDEQLRTPVGEDWTVGALLAHLAFWDRRVVDVVRRARGIASDDEGLTAPEIDIVVNDLSLPIWLALDPREAARLAMEAAEALDERLEAADDRALALVGAITPRWVRRHLHRNEHLDEAEAALRGA